MITLKVHHIGYLVKKIDKAKRDFLALGYEIEADTVYDHIRKVDICFLIKDGYRVELISPTEEDSVVSGLMKRFKNSPYHICYESYNLEADLSLLRENGYAQIDTPTAAPALSGHAVTFLTSASSGMIELIDMR